MLRLALVIVLMLSPLSALAQSVTPLAESPLEQRIRQKKTIVQPKPSPETIKREANQAIDEMMAEQRRDATLRELNRPMAPRPDLDENVTGGIQTRNLRNARPR
jgi:hypothetical protein